ETSIEIKMTVKDDQYNDDDEINGTSESESIFVITVIDDIPSADDDEATVIEDDAQIEGSLLENDTLGADYVGAKVSAIVQGSNTVIPDVDGKLTITGNYGTLVVKSNGDYTYTLNNN